MTMMTSLLAAASAAVPFDPEVATRAYLATLHGAARAKSDAYFEGGYWLPLWGTIVAVLAYWIMLRFGWSAAWSDRARRMTRFPALQAAIYSVPFTIVGALLTLPWTIYTGFFRERQYNLMNQSFGGWFGEYLITLAVSLVVTAIFFMIVFAVIRRAPKSWWAWGAGVTIALLTVMILLAPVFISPLFNKYTPMAEGPMREQILGMAHAQGIPADNVYVFDASKQTKRVSANVSGLGPTIRISLNDNLLNRSTPEGVKAVMGHEMGHYVLNHVEKTLLWFAGIALVGFLLLYWATPRILQRHGARWNVRSVADPAVAPLFAIILSVYFLVLTPLINSIIRTNEIEADVFGLNAAHEPDGFAMTAMQLSEYRKIEPTPLEETLFFDHPSGRTRVRTAMEWKARHLNLLPAEQRRMFVMQPPSEKN